MSGSQIGGVVGGVIGGVIGFYSGNPALGAQIGYGIGSAVGAYVDPISVKGPRLNDAAAQTSNVGVPLPFGYGRFPTAGNIIWRDPTLKEIAKRSRGKGGGTKTTTYSYTRSYAIGVCEGPIYGFLHIKRNGKLVYSSDPDATIEDKAYSAKWLQKAKLYYGTETQMPDSTITAVEGVGNVAPFRGLAYIVVENDDLTDLAGAIPQYEFVVIASAVAYGTSPPYPIEVIEHAAVGGAITDSLLRRIRREVGDTADTALTPALTGMTLRLPRRDISPSVELAAVAPALTSMTLRTTRRSAGAAPELVAVAPALTGMTLRRARIDARPPAEQAAVTPSLTGISLYVK